MNYNFLRHKILLFEFKIVFFIHRTGSIALFLILNLLIASIKHLIQQNTNYF